MDCKWSQQEPIKSVVLEWKEVKQELTEGSQDQVVTIYGYSIKAEEVEFGDDIKAENLATAGDTRDDNITHNTTRSTNQTTNATNNARVANGTDNNSEPRSFNHKHVGNNVQMDHPSESSNVKTVKIMLNSSNFEPKSPNHKSVDNNVKADHSSTAIITHKNSKPRFSNRRSLAKADKSAATNKVETANLTHLKSELRSDKLRSVGERVEGKLLVATIRAANIVHKNSKLKRGSTKQHKCQWCPKIFKKKYNLTRHLPTHTGEKPLRCDFCSKYFLARSSLMKHILNHLGENPYKIKFYKCELCPKQYSQKLFIKFHILQHLGEPLPNKCKMCSRAFALPRDLRLHEITHTRTTTNPFRCVVCPKVFFSNRSFNDHIRASHSSSNAFKIQCHICLKVFTKKSDLKRHRAKHDGKTQRCQHCSKAFSARYNIENHILQNHPSALTNSTSTSEINSTELLVCHICSKKYADKGYLRDHMVSHLRDYKCQICSQSFSRKLVLMYHKATHFEKLPYQCNFCSKWFSSKKKLTSHIIDIHFIRADKLKKQKKCLVCGNVLSTQACLKQHLLTHSGERPQKCLYCDSAFAQRTALRRHVSAIHPESFNDFIIKKRNNGKTVSSKSALNKQSTVDTKEMLHQCPYCIATFALSSSMERHITIIHLKSN